MSSDAFRDRPRTTPPAARDSLGAGGRLAGMASTALLKRTKILVPAILLALVGTLFASILLAAPRTPPALLGASASVNGGLARIHGVIPTEADGWMPPEPSAALVDPPADELHRVRILLELTAMKEDGLSFDPSEYTVSALGTGSWKAIWSSAAPAMARQGESINAMLVFELSDRAIDLALELPGGPDCPWVRATTGAANSVSALSKDSQRVSGFLQGVDNFCRKSPSCVLHSWGIEQRRPACPSHAVKFC